MPLRDLAMLVEDHCEDGLVVFVDMDLDLVLLCLDGQALLDSVLPRRQHDVAVTLHLSLWAVKLVSHGGAEAFPVAAAVSRSLVEIHLVEVELRLLRRNPCPEVFKNLPIKVLELLPHRQLLFGRVLFGRQQDQFVEELIDLVADRDRCPVDSAR